MVEKIIWKVLLVDDDEDDYLLTREMLAMAHGKEVHFKWAASMEDGRSALASELFDAVLIDYDLGEHTGLDLIREVVAKDYPAPLILLTGRGGYEVDIEAMQAGATLYLTKTEVNPLLLDRSLRYAIERKQGEIALKKAHEELEKRVEERTRELALTNQELKNAKLGLEARVAERTTALQSANAQLERLSRLYAMLSKVNETIVRTHDTNALLSNVCEIVAEGGFPVVWIGEIRGHQVVPVARCGSASEYLGEIQIEIVGELSKGPTGTCIREDRTVINSDFDTNLATLPWREKALKYGIRSSAAFPLHRQGKAYGAFTLYSAEPYAFDGERVALLEQLSADISYALDTLDQEQLRIRAEGALRSSEEHYRSLFDGMTEGFGLHEIICDEQGKPCDYRFLEVNPAFEKLTGLQREDVIGKRLKEVLPDDDPHWIEAFGAVALGGNPVHFENYSPSLKQHYEVYAYRPAPYQFAVLFMNVTERKQVDEKLRASEQRYRTLFASMQEGFYLAHIIYDKDGQPCDYEYLDVNPAFERIMGLPREKIIGSRARTLVPKLKPEWVEVFSKVEQSGEPAYHSSYSEAFHQYFEAYAFRPAEGQFAVLVTEITERKEAEIKLELQNQLVDMSFEPIFSWDFNAGIINWNRGCEALYGFSKEEAIGQSSHELLSTRPDPYKVFIPVLSRQGSWTGELRHRTKDGHEVVVESRQQLIEIGGRRLVLESNRNITELKLREKALSEIQDRIKWLARLPDENPNPVLRVAFDGAILYSNPPAVRLPAWRCTVGQTLTGPLMGLVERAATKGEEIDQDVCLDGIFYAISVVPLMDEGYANIYGRDITLRIRAEQGRQKIEERYRTLFNSVKEGFTLNQAIFDEKGKLVDLLVLEANPSAEVANGLKREDFVGKTWKELWPDAEEYWLGICDEVFRTGEEVRNENYAEVHQRWYEVHHFSAGEGLLGSIFMDITDRKIAESRIAAEHEWFSTTLASIGDAVITTDADGSITYLNPVAEKLSGWNNLEAAGLKMEEVFPLFNEQTHTPAENPVVKVLQHGLMVGLANHTVLVSRQGCFIPIEDSAAPIKDKAGNTLGVVMVFHDVTEKRKNEEALHRSEALYRAIARSLPDGAVFVVDHELRYLAIEGEIVERIGLSREKMEGRTIYEALSVEHAALAEDRFKRALAGEFMSFETEFNGRILWSQYLPLVDENGEALAAMAMTLDITTRKHDEDALRETESLAKSYAQKLERSNHELQDFAVIASHDLQEPLRKIKAFGDLLEAHMKDRLDEEEKDYLDRMHSAVQRMQDLIESLLNYARVTTKAQPFRQVDLKALMAEILSGFEVQIERSMAHVEVSNMPCIEADLTQMRQLLQNLVGNALKFQRPGTPPVVQVSCRVVDLQKDEEGGYAQIEVKDNGIGFDLKYIERIFMPFERLHGRGEYEGTGMGLAICKKIVERHQGTITAQSVLGEGSKFIVTMPIKQRS